MASHVQNVHVCRPLIRMNTYTEILTGILHARAAPFSSSLLLLTTVPTAAVWQKVNGKMNN